MWISQKLRPSPPTADADLGVTTIAGGQAGVLTRGEVRSLPIYGPGGYLWMPQNGAEVLVIKGGPGGQEQCVAGMRQAEAEEPMQPGEVLIRGGGASIYLKADGSLLLKGRVCVEGPLLINGEPYKPCTCGEEGTV